MMDPNLIDTWRAVFGVLVTSSPTDIMAAELGQMREIARRTAKHATTATRIVEALCAIAADPATDATTRAYVCAVTGMPDTVVVAELARLAATDT